MTNSKQIPATAKASKKLSGKIHVPGDKSISHRALMLSSQAIGHTEIHGLLEGEDVLATASALKSLGVCITKQGKVWHVDGVGFGGLNEPTQVLDMGNAGTGARLMMGLLAPYPFVSVFTGDESLSKRPMKRVITPLSETGASFMARDDNYLPLSMRGASKPIPITYDLPVASAQVKSAVLLAGLNTPGITTVIEKTPTRDHTERMLHYIGVTVEREGDAIRVHGQPKQKHQDRTIHVPSDPSSAAFPMVAALICEGSEITISNVGLNPHRTGLFTTLQEMGADITIANEREEGGEPVGDIQVKASTLKGVEVPAERAPSMIDEYPILAVAAAYAEGNTVMHGLEELHVKESDRLQAIIDGLSENGVKTELDGDTLTVIGTGGKVAGGGMVTTHFDHRIAMSFLILGLASETPASVDDVSAIATSFTGFVPLMHELGAVIEAEPHAFAQKSKVSAVTQKVPRRIIAIDGPAASGKGTLARKLAEYYGYAYLDTGSLYRAVGVKLVYNDKDPENKEDAIEAANSITDEDLADNRLRQEVVGNAASVVSAIPEVRAILLDYQRDYAHRPKGAVLDGRDIGTVVCPDADFKLFLTADLEARAMRRHKQLQGQGIEVVYESVLEDLRERDERDSQRDAAPLKAANDALQLDTTDMDAQAVFSHVIQMIEDQTSLPSAIRA